MTGHGRDAHRALCAGCDATMTVDEPCAMPVKAHALDDAALFLRMPVTHISARHEHLLICTRGRWTPAWPRPQLFAHGEPPLGWVVWGKRTGPPPHLAAENGCGTS